MRLNLLFKISFGLLALTTIAHAELKVVTERRSNESAAADFKFKTVPSPSPSDLGQKAVWTIIEGERDQNGGELSVLNDGKLPTESDMPAANFFFAQATKGGRLVVDLGQKKKLSGVNSYSWHPDTRGPQVYKLYASDGTTEGFN